jgi:hypothetical protein
MTEVLLVSTYNLGSTDERQPYKLDCFGDTLKLYFKGIGFVFSKSGSIQ